MKALLLGLALLVSVSSVARAKDFDHDGERDGLFAFLLQFFETFEHRHHHHDHDGDGGGGNGGIGGTVPAPLLGAGLPLLAGAGGYMVWLRRKGPEGLVKKGNGVA